MYILGIPGSVILGYLDYFAEAVLLLYLVIAALRGRAKGLFAAAAYVLASVGLGGLRMYAAFRYGPRSHQYALCYWLTDFLLVSALFLLIASLFRRASLGGVPRLWPHVRLMLLLVPVLTAAVSFFIISRHGAHFFPYFVIEFQQDLYFICLVLTTMLYLLVLQYDTGDEQVGLLACGLGMQFAGSAASFALVHITGGQALYGALAGYLPPLCDMGMVLVWLYTAARVPKSLGAREEAKLVASPFRATQKQVAA